MPCKCLIVCLLLVVSCTSLKPDHYLQYIKKNNGQFSTAVQRGNVTTTIIYMPFEYYIARDLAVDSTISTDKLYTKYKNSLYFVVSVKFINGSSLVLRNGLAGYTSSVMENTFGKSADFFLYNGLDTITAATYQFERSWNANNEESFLIVFNRQQLKTDIKKYHLEIKNIDSEIGTIDIRLQNIYRKSKKLKVS